MNIKAIKAFWRLIRNRIKDLKFKIYLFFLDKLKNKNSFSQDIKSLAVLSWDDKLGDAIFTGVMISMIKKYKPDINITVISGVVSQSWLDFIVGINFINCGRRGMKAVRFCSQFSGEFDTIIYLGSDFGYKELCMLRSLKATNYIGYNKKEYNIFNLDLGSEYIHFYDRNIASANSVLGLDLIKPQSIPYPDFSEQESYLIPFILPMNGYLKVAVNLFGAGKYRQFSFEQAISLLTQWLDLFTSDILILMPVPGKIDFLNNLISKINNNRLLISPLNIGFKESLALINAVDIIFTPDTSVVHMASALNKPVLAIYQNSEHNYLEWGPLNINSCVVFNTKPTSVNDRVQVADFKWDDFITARNEIAQTL